MYQRKRYATTSIGIIMFYSVHSCSQVAHIFKPRVECDVEYKSISQQFNYAKQTSLPENCRSGSHCKKLSRHLLTYIKLVERRVPTLQTSTQNWGKISTWHTDSTSRKKMLSEFPPVISCCTWPIVSHL